MELRTACGLHRFNSPQQLLNSCALKLMRPSCSHILHPTLNSTRPLMYSANSPLSRLFLSAPSKSLPVRRTIHNGVDARIKSGADRPFFEAMGAAGFVRRAGTPGATFDFVREAEGAASGDGAQVLEGAARCRGELGPAASAGSEGDAVIRGEAAAGQ